MTTIEKICAAMGSVPPNVDKRGIHYGVIGQNAVAHWAWEEFFNHGIDLNYQDSFATATQDAEAAIEDNWDDGVEAVRAQFHAVFDDYDANIADEIVEAFDPGCSKEEALQSARDYLDSAWGQFMPEFDEAEYLLVEFANGDIWDGTSKYDEKEVVFKAQWSGTDIWIYKSKWVKLAAQCSPCAPNAGHLESPVAANSMGAPVLAYCLPDTDEWFDPEFNPCPYPGEAILLEKCALEDDAN